MQGFQTHVSRLCVRARAYNRAEYEHSDASASLAPLQASQGAGMQQLQEVAADGVVVVTFWLQYQAEFGQRICVVGNCVGLGMWQHKAAPELQWNEGHLWSVTVEVPAAQVLEYKYVVMQPDGLTALHWQSGNNAVLALMPDDEQIEIFDNWYDPASSMVAPNGRPRTTRSDRLALWANQMSGSVGQLRGELRATRMSVFEAQQGMKEALEQVKHTQDCLSEQVEENQKMAEQVLTMQEKNRKMRLQLIESQTLFKEVMAEARAIILSTVESPDETDDELMHLSDMGFGSPRITAEAEDTSRHVEDSTASESEYEYEDEDGQSDQEEFYDVEAEAEYQQSGREEETEDEAEEEEEEEDEDEEEGSCSEEEQEPLRSHQPQERTRLESTAQLAQQESERNKRREPAAQPQQRQQQAQPQAVDEEEGDVPAPVLTPASSAVPQSCPAHKTAFPGGHMTVKNGYAPRRTSRRSPVTMVDMPKPSASTPSVASPAATTVAGATSSGSLRESDTARYGQYGTDPVDDDDDEDTTGHVDASRTAASLKKMLHTKAVPATEAAGALLEAQVKLEAGLDGASSSEDLEWLTDQAESLLSVFEQLEDDVYEAQQAVGRVISEA